MATTAVWLKLIVPLFERLPPMDRVCVAAATPAWKVPPRLTVALPPSVNDRAVAGSYCNVPPLLTVRLRATAAVSMVTIEAVAMTASSAAVGTWPHDQVPGLLQLPVANEVQVTLGYFGGAGGIGAHSSALCIANPACPPQASRRPAPPRCNHGPVCP